ncbi:hypothetical protein [Maridesulfovibrio bastinii]|uniref:hypothetical protein n=1 Tax=Maridesulfovibrio bastinii TaxID=47157 RepID=UPI000417C5E3|nr:hypothetical protein [Maridesulfovibrio bastinii]
MQKIDVLINAYGKPYQTALSLLSLIKHSRKWIDRIWFVADRPDETKNLGPQFVLQMLPNVTVYKPQEWRWVNNIDESLLGDEKYRYSIRYQYGWEHSDKDYVLIIHNDVYFKGDAIGLLMDRIGDCIAAGEIGLCVQCPAYHHKKCSPEKYLEFRPDLKEFVAMAKDPKGYLPTDAVNYMVCPSLHSKPWPLPSCRVNEWCALINLKKARPITSPFGSARPFGAHVFEGVMSKTAEDQPWEEYKSYLGIKYDTGMAWFRDVHHAGYICAHQSLSGVMDHWTGHKSLFNSKLYEANELRAKKILEAEFRLKFS